MLKKLLIIIAVIIAIFIFATIVLYFTIMRPMFKEVQAVSKMEISTIDINQVKDGIYAGDFTYGKFTYEVSVIVTNHKIESIKVVKSTGTKHAMLAGQVLVKIIEKQSPNVDAITGATTTSKAFMKAVEKALIKGIQK